MKIERFEEILAWQKSRQLAQVVYEMTGRKDYQRDYDQIRQIRRAASSIMHNIAEGFDSGTDAEMIRFLRFARRSASEVQSEAYLAMDLTYISSQDFQRIYQQAVEIKKLINAFIRYLSTSSHMSIKSGKTIPLLTTHDFLFAANQKRQRTKD